MPRTTFIGLAVTTFLLLIVALVFSIIGCATPYWLILSTVAGTTTFGLWEQCITVHGITGCIGISSAPLQLAWLTEIRAMEVIGWVLLIPAVIQSGICLCKESARNHTIATFVFSFLAGVATIVGVIIGLVGIKTDPIYYPFDLGWSFALEVAGGVLSIIAGILSSVNYCCSGAYGPVSGAYGPVSGAYGPVSGAYGPASGAYGPASGAYGPASGAYGSLSGAYGPVYRVME